VVEQMIRNYTGVVRPTLLYIGSEAVIPAKAEILRRYIILHYQPDTLDELETMDQLVPFCVKLNMAVFPGSHFLQKQ